jgi:hypothetical protein
MKNFAVLSIIALVLSLFSCNDMLGKRIDGNGKLISQQRQTGEATRIHTISNFDVDITQGSAFSLQVEADENLLPYIITEIKDGVLEVRTQEGVNLHSVNKIKVHLMVTKLESVDLTGSGNVTGIDSFSGADHLKLDIEGTGNISLAVNTPSIDASIAGTGDITLSGQTRDAAIDIAGVGNYKAENLKAENVKVSIAGSGDAKLFASTTLDIDIAGSGNIYYHGSPSITQRIAGSGTIKQLP